MITKVRLGILGTGNMARAFAAGLQHARHVELTAVASRREESARQFADDFRVPAQFSCYQALADCSDLDLVYIATPHTFHARHGLMCLNAGKAVLLEKPFTINATEAELLIETARGKGLFLMEAMWTRFIPAVVKLRELLATQRIGKVQMMLAGGAFQPAFDAEAYLFRPDLGGGVLLDAGVYLVSLASMVFGAPKRILAAGAVGNSGVDEQDAIVLQHSDDELATLYVSLRASTPPEATLLGEQGSIRVHAPIFAPPALTLSVTGEADQFIELPFEGNGYQYQADEAARCILTGQLESTVMPLQESLTIMRTMDQARQQIGLEYPMESAPGKG